MKLWNNELFPIGTEKGLAGRLYEALYSHLYKITGAKTVWVDVDFPLVARTTGAGKPTYQTFNTDFEMLRWAVNDNLIAENQEFIHGWKEGSLVTWHLHMVTNGTNVDNRYVKWRVNYCYAPNMGAYNATQTVEAEILIPANTPANTMIIAPIGTFTPTGLTIGSHCKAKLTRIASAGTAPTNDPFVDMLQMHLECDSLGSGAIQTK